MSEKKKVTTQGITDWLRQFEGRVINIRDIMHGLNISPTQEGTFRVLLSRLAKQKEVIKPSGERDGNYQVLKRVKPVRWMDADETSYFDLSFPRSHTDESSFCLENLISISPGDLIIIAGVSNTGKSALALNFLAENMDKYPCVLMGNEYTSMGNAPSPKFKRRLLNMNWANWLNENGESKFELWPIRDNFEDYVQKDKINLIDWVNLDDEFWKIGHITEEIKDAVGGGVAIVVLQKSRSKEQAVGGDFSERMADAYLTVDPYGNWESRLTIGRVKAPKCHATGRSWAFKIVDGGANLHEIREVERCWKCHGKGYALHGECPECAGKGYRTKSQVDLPK